jgi:hypothetical protein
MPDRHGTPLQPGDPVLFLDAGEAIPATVLREQQNGRYVIQLDPRQPRASRPSDLPAGALAPLDRSDTALRDVDALGIDPQDPFEVPGAQLEFFADRPHMRGTRDTRG